MTTAEEWARILLEAEGRADPVAPLTDRVPDLGTEEAYAIQAQLVRAKCRAGQTVVGAKLGLTSAAKRIAMGVDEPVFGVLTSGMSLRPDEDLECSQLIHPRVEPEIVLILGEDLAGPRVAPGDVLDATEWVACGLEVIDSRYAEFRFTHADVIADNTSAARFKLGSQLIRPGELPELSELACELCVDGQPVATATGADIMGHPATAVALLANWLAERGRNLNAGAIILSGGMTDAVHVSPGVSVSANFTRLGTVALRAL